MVELKKCPFCGCTAREYEGNMDAHGVCCNNCTAKIYGYATKAAAKRAWNRRAHEKTD